MKENYGSIKSEIGIDSKCKIPSNELADACIYHHEEISFKDITLLVLDKTLHCIPPSLMILKTYGTLKSKKGSN